MSNDSVVSLAAPAFGVRPAHGASAQRRAAADRGGGGGGVRGVPVGVRGREVAGRSAPGGAQRSPSRTPDSDGDRRGGRSGTEGAWSLGGVGAVPPWLYLHGVSTGQMRAAVSVLVVIGVNARGEKHFLAIEDGVRESTQSWREVLLGMQQRGFTRPAKLAVGDGALGFWSERGWGRPRRATAAV